MRKRQLHSLVSLLVSTIPAAAAGLAEWRLKLVARHVHRDYGLAILVVTVLFALVIVFYAMQFVRFWSLAKSLPVTCKHYIHVLTEAPSTHWKATGYLLVLLVAIVTTNYISGLPWRDILRNTVNMFLPTGLFLGLLVYWADRKVLAPHPGLPVCADLVGRGTFIETPSSGPNDQEIRHVLFGLTNQDFIFIWAIHYSHVLGAANKSALVDIKHLVDANPKAAVLVLLQCPYSSDVIERAAELECPHGKEYVQELVESIANCLASDRIKVRLRHGKPQYRAVIWGTMGKGSPYGALEDGAVTGGAAGSTAPGLGWGPCARYLNHVQEGGFLLQRYLRGMHGAEDTLLEVDATCCGAMWYMLRNLFLIEFNLATVPTEEWFNAGADIQALQRLVQGLGLEGKKVLSAPHALREKVERHEFRNLLNWIARATAERQAKLAELPNAGRA